MRSVVPGSMNAFKPAGKGVAFALLTAGVVAALVGGVLSALLPWWFVAMMLLLPLLAVTGVLFPEFAIVGLLILLCGLLPASLTPQIALGPGIVKAHELALLLLFGLALVRLPRLPALGQYWAWLRPILLLLALTVTAIAVGRLVYASPFKEVLSDARTQIAWLTVFIVVYLVQSKDQLKRLSWGIVFVGLLVAVAVIAQFATGRPFIQNARVEDVVTLNQANPDVVRSMAGGGIYVIVFSILLLLARLMTRSVRLLVAAPLLVVLVAAVVVTFGRGIWISTMLVCLLMAYRLTRWKGVVNTALAGVLGLAIGLALLASFKPAVIGVAYERLLSTTQETLGRNTTLGWRAEESRFALNKIGTSPLWGIGMGTSYKPLIRMNGVTVTESDETLTRYIHNAYLGLWLKFGVVGLLAVLWLGWGTVRRGLALLRQTVDPHLRSLTAATLAAFLVPLITSVTQPEWLTQTGIAFFALMLGLLICAHRLTPAVQAVQVAPAAQRRNWDTARVRP